MVAGLLISTQECLRKQMAENGIAGAFCLFSLEVSIQFLQLCSTNF